MSICTISTNPKNIGDIKYWFDSSDVSTLSLTGIGSVTASVISIRDKISGVVLSSTGTVRPLYYYNIINNNNSIFFQYTNTNSSSDTTPSDRLSSNSCTFSSIGSIYTVTRGVATYTYQFAITISPSSRGFNTFGDYQVIYYSPGWYQVFSVLNASPFNTPVASFGHVFDGANPSIVGLRHNANSLTKFHGISTDVKNGYTNATYSISSLSNRLTIGDYYTLSDSDFGFRGYFCEMIYYTRYLTDTEHDKVIQYLKKKWID